MTDRKTDRKILVYAGVVMSLIAAGIQGRKLIEDKESMPEKSANPFRLTWNELKTVLIGTLQALGSKNLPTLAAGVAYFSTLALFPMLAAGVAIAALLISPAQLDYLITTVKTYLPDDISGLIGTQLQTLVSRRAENVMAAIIAIAVALFSASGASKNLVIASNVAYGVRESRGWIAQQAWGLVWTVGGLVFGLVLVSLLAVNSTFFSFIGLPSFLISAILYGRWIVIVLFAVLGLSLFYKFGPNRPHVRWQWLNWGALAATAVWMIATSGFFVYVQYFANYGRSYSVFAGIIMLMVWMNISALIVMLGAELNRQLELAAKR